MKIEKEDFDQWLAHPVTEQVMRALKALSEKSKEKWLAESWEAGNPDPLLLADLRARAQVITDLTDLKLEDIQDDEERESERHSAD